ncbi:ABC transporter ATP-binding protein [Advenella alkanexedens]|uniref:ABC transporter ATP-binding protein n=1 Tax=Advenella alkanexedens TaxID=1481665 RepID=A0ABS6NLK0_9BURK|nr:ABC transporter ATP-binding protein [Advenella alkanexedens]MBV4396244.1 ABC transporter ATP-binding protein [Advenella alkanexedens]
MGTITVNNLGKAYKQYKTRWSRLAEWVLPGKRKYHDLKWVLRDISFNVGAGEAVGIIGINGAGKSTLLKMITGTTQPTTGSINIAGRVAALLELGIGFHPDFTGRQNVYMAGQLIGYSVEEISSLMPAIEAFAEIGDYIDMPVRVYSSGMQMRLAFSVATAKRPDILIIDEALSVGDAYFQHKSFDRIREFNGQGTTLLIVSHDKAAIQSICDKAILLNAGRMAMEGKPEAVMDYYNALLADKEGTKVEQKIQKNGKIQTVSGTGEVTVTEVLLLNEAGQAVEAIEVGQNVVLQVTTTVHKPVSRLVLGYGIKDRLGQVMYGTNTHHTQQILENLEADKQCVFNIKFPANLGPGTYSVQIALTGGVTHLELNYEWRDLALIFDVVNTSRILFAGSSWIEPKIEVVM